MLSWVSVYTEVGIFTGGNLQSWPMSDFKGQCYLSDIQDKIVSK